ncbi:hypothetical protein [Gimesia maris]|uniref:hypothetical protein n=2 Tax=Gimesia maris TaxID=122 RepID=UPI00118D1733|nr:hypothetical protein [Gimesia maris]QDU14899.1 hypothetical protein CA11_27110 [Gimesia maris]
MKNLMSNLKGMNYKEFAISHGEKIVLGFIALFVFFVIFTSQWTTEKRTPAELEQKVNTAETQVSNSQWPEEKRNEYLKEDDLRQKVAALMNKPLEVTPYMFTTKLSWPIYAKKAKAKEVDWLAVEDLVATYGRVIMQTRPISATLEGSEEGKSTEGEKAKPDEPEYDAFKRRTTGMAGGMGGPGGAAMAGLTFGGIPGESEMMMAADPGAMDPGFANPDAYSAGLPEGMGMEGGMGMTGPVREGRGLRFVAVRGVFDLATQQDKLERSLGDAFSFQNMQTGKILEFLDFQLQRKKAIPGEDPWAGEWKDVDIETSIEILKESADFDPEVVNSGITDRVFTMPLPSRIAGFWYKVATHPRVENFTLSQEEIEQELEFNRRILDQYKKTHSNEKVFKEKQKGFSTLQLDMRGMRSELMYGGGGASEMDMVMQDTASSMMQGRPGNPNEPMDEKKLIQKLKANVTAAGRLLLFRYFDFDLNPGETYKYRVRLVVRNPNFQRPIDEVVLPAVAEGETRTTPWSNETAAVTAEEDVHFYLQSVRPPRGIAGTTANFEIYQWYPKTGTTIQSTLKTSIGDEIGGEQVAELYDVAKEEYDEKATVEFDTQNYLVDAVPAPTIRLEDHPDLNLPAKTRGHLPIQPEAVIVDNFGNLKKSLPPAVSSSYADVKKKFSRERDSLTWVKEASEARTAAPTDGFDIGFEGASAFEGMEAEMLGPPQRGSKSKRRKNPIRLGP